MLVIQEVEGLNRVIYGLIDSIFWGVFSVTKCNRAEIALSLLRENKNGFDIVISDVHMPDMDGFKLLEHVGLEMDLPVISKHLVLVILDGTNC